MWEEGGGASGDERRWGGGRGGSHHLLNLWSQMKSLEFRVQAVLLPQVAF